MVRKQQLIILITLVVVIIAILYILQPKEQVVLEIPTKNNDVVLNETSVIDSYHVVTQERDKAAVHYPPTETAERSIGENRMLFVDPEGIFSFEYISDETKDYRFERHVSDYYPIGIDVDITTFKIKEDSIPDYDYGELINDPEISGSFEKTELNGYPAYKAVFRYKQYPERYLFIHIPHNNRLFTLRRSATNQDFIFEQFSVISETFKLLK